jgi:3-oxoadipate enol-lactonase
MEKKIITSDKVKINYDIQRGNKNLSLIFIHGLGGDLNVWKRERAFFHRRGFSTIGIDIRGHGLSGRPDLFEDYRLDRFAEDIHEVIKKEKIRKFILIGHCFGGIIIIKFHNLYPNLAKSYILIDTTYKSPKVFKIIKNHPFFLGLINHLAENKLIRKKHFSHVRFQKNIGTGDWNMRRILLSDIAHTSLKSWLYSFESIAGFKGITELKSIKKPVLIIEGKEDSIFNLKIAQKIHRLVSTSQLVIIPGANHQVILNNIKEVERIIWAYINHLEENNLYNMNQ